jgi:hypothetical protein
MRNTLTSEAAISYGDIIQHRAPCLQLPVDNPALLVYNMINNTGGLRMRRAFLHTKKFDNQWSDMGCDDDDLLVLQQAIIANPNRAPVISGTGGVRKIRVSLEGRGKRGGARVLYVDYVLSEVVALLTAYPKNEKESISPEEKKLLKAIAAQIEQGWRNKK